MKTLFISAILCSIQITPVCIAGEYVKIGKTGLCDIILSDKKDSIKSSLMIEKYTDTMPHNRCWGSDWENPKTIIARMQIWINDKEIIVPLSCYADLTNCNWAKIVETMMGYRLIIKGGDAATSYKAMIDFAGNKVFRRKVQSGEFPDQGWEMTIYSTPEKLDP